MNTAKLSVSTANREEMVDITRRLNELAAEHGWQDGALLVYCPHTTGAVTVNEGADPDVAADVMGFLHRLVPKSGGQVPFRHAEGNSDAHVKASLVGPDQMLFLDSGRISLGTWQRVFFCEFDGPRSRTLWVRHLPG